MRKINFTQLRVITLLSGLVLVPLIGSTQQTPPAAYGQDAKINYIRTWDALAPESDANALMSRPLKDVRQTTQYLDGLGRPLQTVIKQGSLPTGGTPVDMVSAVVYDEFGREQYKYLPFPSNNTGSNPNIDNGLFKLNPFQQQASFYGDPNGILKGQNETFFYGQSKFEASPLNRVEETSAPGNSWAGTSANTNEANRRSVKVKYFLNTATDDVKIWNVADVANTFGTYSMAGTYPAGELYKNVTADEHGKQVIEFKDKAGKVILKKVQLTASADDGSGRDYTGWLSTYYVYDDFNNLRCVIQPEGVKYLFTNNWPAISTIILNEQCFRYEYDARNRMIKKEVPGAGEVDMVYDARDRLVMMQDANMRVSNKWLVTKYDELNRPIETGLWVDATAFTTHLTNASTSTNYPVTSTGYEELTKTFYDDYSWLAANGNPFPSSNYDNSYNTHFQATSDVNWPYGQANVQSFQLKGMPTGNKIKILGTATYLYTISFYDAKGRVIQVQSKNIRGTDIMTTQYTWAGQPLVMIQKQEKQGVNAQTSVVVSQMIYDDLGRLVKTEKKLSNTGVNSNAMSAYKTIAQHEYDKLGQLKNKKLAPAYNNNAGLETLTYDYNIRGWMLGANRDYAKDVNNTNYFGFDLGYDKTNNSIIGNQTYANPQYNGNIEGMVWKSKGDGEKRKYDFTYDAANRLLKADFNQYTSSSFTKTAGIDFSMQMGDGINVSTAYDENGNIKAMKQWGLKITGSSVIDDLNYTYYDNSNKLKNVIDQQSDPQTKLGDFRYSSLYATALGGPKSNTATDYTYDDNGNLKKDRNKDIGDASNDGIVYNHLNLPQTITVRTTNGAIKGTITYTYDAAGNKLKKEVTETAQPTKTTLYLGAIYENDVLQFLGHEEGRIRFKPANGSIPASFQFDYMLKDHLGNVRVVLTEEQQTDAYPPASMETAQATTEETLYSNLNTTRTDKPAGYPTDTYTNPNDKVARVKAAAGSQKIGPAIVLKVMAGDKFNIRANSWYKLNGTTPGTPVSPLTELVAALTGSVGNITGTHGGATAAELQSNDVFSPGATSFLNSQTPDVNKPKAYLNWILFDEQFKFVSSNSSAEQVGNDQEFKTHIRNSLPIDKSGYLYVYVSNETPNIDVFFDNLQVTHIRGAMLETNEYYPFGLQMKNLCYRSMKNGYAENKLMFNDGTELNTSLDVSLYETDFRLYDPQIGRFVQSDELAEEFDEWSPYTFANDNPILLNDPTGLFSDSLHPVVGQEVIMNSRPIQKPLSISNGAGMVFQKNYNFNPWSEDPYKRQAYLNFRAWDHSSTERGTTAEMLSEWAEFALWLVPSSKLVKGAKWLFALGKAKQILGLARLAYASRFGIKSYKVLRALNNVAKTQVHHLIEKRFVNLFSAKADDMLSIVVTETEHQAFTNAWREAIPYATKNAVGLTTKTATPEIVQEAARNIYKDYPEILKALKL